MIERLEATLEKYEKLQCELTKPEVLNDIKKTSDKQFKFIHIEGAHVPYNYDKDVKRKKAELNNIGVKKIEDYNDMVDKKKDEISVEKILLLC